MKKIFSIGTVVRVGINEELLMIISRYPMTIKEGVKGYFEYEACLYPTGIEIDENSRMFNHEDIAEVLFEGYVNPMEEKLREYYRKHADSIPYPKLSIHE